MRNINPREDGFTFCLPADALGPMVYDYKEDQANISGEVRADA